MEGSHSLLIRSDSSLALRCRKGAIHPIIRSVPSARTCTPSASVVTIACQLCPQPGEYHPLSFSARAWRARQSASDAFLEDCCIASRQPRSHYVFQRISERSYLIYSGLGGCQIKLADANF